MNNFFYTYNNEAIACCTIYTVLRKLTKITAAVSSLILPFLLNDRIVEKMIDAKSNNLLDFVSANRKVFINFNGKYVSFLPITINSVVLLKDFGLIWFEDDNSISIKQNDEIDFSHSGERLNQIISVSDNFSEMLKNTDIVQLFNELKIKL